MTDLAMLIIERIDKKEKSKLPISEVCNVIHIKGRGIDEYYKILGKKEDLNEGWLKKAIKNFYASHDLNFPKTINIIYFKRD